MSQSDIVEYYSEAGQDYSAWSPAFNMHFGYYRKWMNPFRLEPMLEQMNAEILSRMTGGKPAREMEFLDAGCGLGATARHIARQASAKVLGITIVPWQIEEAGKLAARAGLSVWPSFPLKQIYYFARCLFRHSIYLLGLLLNHSNNCYPASVCSRV